MQTREGRVIALFKTAQDSKTSQRVETLQLDPNGIIGDKHYGKDALRTILLSSTKSYTMVKDALETTMPLGYLGENILVDIDIYDLPVGTQMRIGDTVLEITQNCTLCTHLATLHKSIPKLLRNDRGMFAKTITAGEINEGDDVIVLI